MDAAAQDIGLAASGRLKALAGPVSITASDAFCAYILPPLVQDLRALAPEVEIEIVSSNALQDLRRREADIAIRHVRPEQPELIARLIRESTAHLYAARSYLDAYGRPSSIGEIDRHAVFIGPETSDRVRLVLAEMGIKLEPEQFRVHTNSGVAAWELVKQGLGFILMAREIADVTPHVESVLEDDISIDMSYWIVTHRELLTSPRIRLVYQFLGERLKDWDKRELDRS